MNKEFQFRTTRKLEALKSLEKLEETLNFIENDVYQWKWAIIFLHNCIQAFMVLTLQGTDSVDIMKDRKRYLEWLKSDQKDTNRKFDMASFLILYKRIKDSDETQLYYSKKKFCAEDIHDNSMKMLNDFRNNFIHYKLVGWTVCGSHVKMFKSVMEIINFMVIDIGNLMHHYDNKEVQKIKYLLSNIEKKLDLI